VLKIVHSNFHISLILSEYNNSPSFVSHVGACTSIMQVDDELAGEGEDETEAKAEE
jgi:hypothetical protein